MPTTETRRLNPLVLLGIVLAAIVLAIVAVRTFTRDTVEIRVAAVNHQNLLRTVSTNGRVEPVEIYQAHAAAPGVVEKIYVEVGQKVRSGDLLIKMNDSDAVMKLASANSTLSAAELNHQNTQQNGSQEERIALEADLSRAELRQKQAQADLAALRQLQQKGAASPAEVASAEQRLQEASAALESTRQRGTQRYSAGDLARAQAQVGRGAGSPHRCPQQLCSRQYPVAAIRDRILHSCIDL